MKRAAHLSQVHGLNILMELADERAPLSRTALKERSGLTPSRLDEALRELARIGLVKRQSGPRGRYYLKKSPEGISVEQLRRAFRSAKKDGRSDGARLTNDVLSNLGPKVTLTELRNAMQSVDLDLCPYYDACVLLGGPTGPHIHSECKAIGNGSCAC
jgi:DNA-binding IscR family transcriptional regulator